MTKPKLRTRARRYLRAALLKSVVALLGLLPVTTARRLGRSLGRLAHFVAARERNRARDHLRIAYPDSEEAFIEETARRCFENLGEHVLELCVVRRSEDTLGRIVHIADGALDPLDEALEEGRGCIVVSGHIGSWELAARTLAHRGYEVVAVARRFHDPWLGALVEGFRTKGGVVTLPRGAPGTVKNLLKQIRKGGFIFMLVDQDTSVSSVFVPFFGRPAKTPRGPADLALKTGAAIAMGFIHRDPVTGVHSVSAERLSLPPATGDRDLDAASIMTTINRRLEREIRAYPADWVWFHERWRSQPGDQTGDFDRRAPARAEKSL